MAARIAGVLYLVIIVAGTWSEAFVRSSLIVAGDAATTAANILANEGLFRLSFAADTIMTISDVALAVLLYMLLKPVSQTLALMAMAFRLIQAAILATNLLNQYAVLLILNGTGLDGSQLEALALLSLEMQSHGYDLGLIFFAINSLLIGYLLIKADFLPGLIGALMAAAGVVYLVGSYLLFLAPSAAEVFAYAYVVPVITEASFALYLLIRGFNATRWLPAAQPGPRRA
jgi:hypothetical protein